MNAPQGASLIAQALTPDPSESGIVPAGVACAGPPSEVIDLTMEELTALGFAVEAKSGAWCAAPAEPGDQLTVLEVRGTRRPLSGGGETSPFRWVCAVRSSQGRVIWASPRVAL